MKQRITKIAVLLSILLAVPTFGQAPEVVVSGWSSPLRINSSARPEGLELGLIWPFKKSSLTQYPYVFFQGAISHRWYGGISLSINEPVNFDWLGVGAWLGHKRWLFEYASGLVSGWRHEEASHAGLTIYGQNYYSLIKSLSRAQIRAGLVITKRAGYARISWPVDNWVRASWTETMRPENSFEERCYDMNKSFFGYFLGAGIAPVKNLHVGGLVFDLIGSFVLVENDASDKFNHRTWEYRSGVWHRSEQSVPVPTSSATFGIEAKLGMWGNNRRLTSLVFFAERRLTTNGVFNLAGYSHSMKTFGLGIVYN